MDRRPDLAQARLRLRVRTFAAFFVLLVLALSGAKAQQGQAVTTPKAAPGKTVLVFLSGTSTDPIYRTFFSSFSAEIERLDPRIRPYIRDVDLNRSPSREAWDAAEAFIRAGRSGDLFLVLDQSAATFWTERLRDFHTEVPVLSIGTIRRNDFGAGRKAIYVKEPGTLLGTAKLAHGLFPGARHLYLFVALNGPGEVEPFRSYVDTVLRPALPGITLDIVTERRIDALLGSIATLPADSLALFATAPIDAHDGFVPHSEVMRMVGEVAPRLPVFSILAPTIEGGAVGGMILDYDKRGREAANLVADLLSGKEVADHDSQGATYLFNWKALRRFGLRESALPAGSVTLGKPEPFFVSHAQEVFYASLLLGFLLVVVALLLASRSWRFRLLRRNAAELEEAVRSRTGELAVANEELAASNASLVSALRRIEEAQEGILKAERAEASRRLAARIAHELNTPLGAILSSTRGLKAASDRLSADSPPWLREADAEGLALASALAEAARGALPAEGLARRRRIAALEPMAGPGLAERLADLGFEAEDPLVAAILARADATSLVAEAERRASLHVLAVVIETAADQAAGKVADLREYLGPSPDFTPVTGCGEDGGAVAGDAAGDVGKKPQV